MRRHTNFQPPRWCCHGARFPAFSFLAGVKGPPVSMYQTRACGSPRAFRRQALLIGPFDFRDAPGVLPRREIVLPGARLVEFDHQRRLRADILEEMRKVPPRAEVKQV